MDYKKAKADYIANLEIALANAKVSDEYIFMYQEDIVESYNDLVNAKKDDGKW